MHLSKLSDSIRFMVTLSTLMAIIKTKGKHIDAELQEQVDDPDCPNVLLSRGGDHFAVIFYTPKSRLPMINFFDEEAVGPEAREEAFAFYIAWCRALRGGHELYMEFLQNPDLEAPLWKVHELDRLAFAFNAANWELGCEAYAELAIDPEVEEHEIVVVEGKSWFTIDPDSGAAQFHVVATDGSTMDFPARKGFEVAAQDYVTYMVGP